MWRRRRAREGMWRGCEADGLGADGRGWEEMGWPVYPPVML